MDFNLDKNNLPDSESSFPQGAEGPGMSPIDEKTSPVHHEDIHDQMAEGPQTGQEPHLSPQEPVSAPGWAAQGSSPDTEPQPPAADRQPEPQTPPSPPLQSGWNTGGKPAGPEAPKPGWNLGARPPEQDMPRAGWNHEQRTPYQTPVRGQSPAPQYTAPPKKEEDAPFTTYQQWQQQVRQEKETTAGAEQKKKKRPVLRVLAGALAAAALFAGGIWLGNSIDMFPVPDNSGAGDPGVTTPEIINPDAPSLQITPGTGVTSTAYTDGLSGEEIYEKASPSVVSVVATSLTTSETSTGSGVVMSADGYIITNQHVIAGADRVTIVMADGMQHNATIVGSDVKTDLAVLKVSADTVLVPAEFGDSSQIRAGERAYAIGSPGGLELANTITTGSISAISRDITVEDRVMTLIQTDASINPGNSGGALINKYGQVIGITSAKLGISYYEGLGFAIPIDSAKEVIDQLLEYGYVPGRPSIGITGYNISEQTAKINGVPQGVLITKVDARSDAAQKGLQARDIIIGVNGNTITTMDEINEEKESRRAGDSITLTVYRMSADKTFEITIVLADENDLTSVQEEQPARSSGGSGSYYFPWFGY